MTKIITSFHHKIQYMELPELYFFLLQLKAYCTCYTVLVTMAPGDSEGIPRDGTSYVEELCSDINNSLHTKIIFRLT